MGTLIWAFIWRKHLSSCFHLALLRILINPIMNPFTETRVKRGFPAEWPHLFAQNTKVTLMYIEKSLMYIENCFIYDVCRKVLFSDHCSILTAYWAFKIMDIQKGVFDIHQWQNMTIFVTWVFDIHLGLFGIHQKHFSAYIKFILDRF